MKTKVITLEKYNTKMYHGYMNVSHDFKLMMLDNGGDQGTVLVPVIVVDEKTTESLMRAILNGLNGWTDMHWGVTHYRTANNRYQITVENYNAHATVVILDLHSDTPFTTVRADVVYGKNRLVDAKLRGMYLLNNLPHE